jgi:tRNA threonylcarbamoyladenosine biosynthesis protein TsaB
VRILALDTSTASGSVALLDGDTLVGQLALADDVGALQSFAPAMDDLLRRAAWSPTDVQLVATTIGPGSFTGLRIGVTAAKTLAYAVGAELVALNTLDVLTHQLPEDVTAACAVMYAQRGELFAATYARLPDRTWEPITGCRIVSPHALVEQLADGTVVTGPAAQRIPDPLPAGVGRADPACWLPRAATVGHLAWRRYEAGQRDDPMQLVPQYYRPSYAEVKGRRSADA